MISNSFFFIEGSKGSNQILESINPISLIG